MTPKSSGRLGLPWAALVCPSRASAVHSTTGQTCCVLCCATDTHVGLVEHERRQRLLRAGHSTSVRSTLLLAQVRQSTNSVVLVVSSRRKPAGVIPLCQGCHVAVFRRFRNDTVFRPDPQPARWRGRQWEEWCWFVLPRWAFC